MAKRTSIKVLEDKIKFQQPWNKNAKFPKTEAEILDWLDGLTWELSPENLHCDGEITAAQAQTKYRKIMREWRALEDLLGRSVSEDYMYGYSRKKYNY